MDEETYRGWYNNVWRFIDSEQKMRERVFPEGNPKRAAKLGECAAALADLLRMKDAMKPYLLPTPVQGRLVADDATDKRGY